MFGSEFITNTQNYHNYNSEFKTSMCMFYKIQKNICKMKLNYLVKGIFPPMEKKGISCISSIQSLLFQKHWVYTIILRTEIKYVTPPHLSSGF